MVLCPVVGVRRGGVDAWLPPPTDVRFHGDTSSRLGGVCAWDLLCQYLLCRSSIIFTVFTFVLCVGTWQYKRMNQENNTLTY